MSNTTPLLQLEQVHKTFISDEIETHALVGVNLNVLPGEYLCISGPSGCGKSTLLALMGLLDTCTRGSITFDGRTMANTTRDQRARIRNCQIGFIFQSYNLISDLTVEENIALPLNYREDLDQAQVADRVAQALDRVGLPHRNRHFPSQLSGGQQQQVAVARAVAGRPALILADEPTGNLDSHNAERVMDLLASLHTGGTTLCLVTHNPKAVKGANRWLELFDGRVVADRQDVQSLGQTS